MNVRDAFFSQIYKKVQMGEDIVIVSSDIGAPSLDDFRRDFPERFINVGIAEQNSIAVAGGLSLAGKKVVTYGLNPFPVTRAFDQIRNILASLQIPITVTALNAGSCSAEAGYTHLPIENMSIMRTLKNVRICNPTDESMSEKLVSEIIDHPRPRYVQFDKYIGGKSVDYNDLDFEKGYITCGKGVTAVITYGIYAHELRKRDLPVKLIDCFCLPVNEEAFVSELEGMDKIYVIEDAVAAGGIGSMVLEIANERNIRIPIERKALLLKSNYPNEFVNRNLLWEKEGMTLDLLEREILG